MPRSGAVLSVEPAEAVGFEPTTTLPRNGFRDCPDRMSPRLAVRVRGDMVGEAEGRRLSDTPPCLDFKRSLLAGTPLRSLYHRGTRVSFRIALGHVPAGYGAPGLTPGAATASLLGHHSPPSHQAHDGQLRLYEGPLTTAGRKRAAQTAKLTRRVQATKPSNRRSPAPACQNRARSGGKPRGIAVTRPPVSQDRWPLRRRSAQ